VVQKIMDRSDRPHGLSGGSRGILSKFHVSIFVRAGLGATLALAFLPGIGGTAQAGPVKSVPVVTRAAAKAAVVHPNTVFPNPSGLPSNCAVDQTTPANIICTYTTTSGTTNGMAKLTLPAGATGVQFQLMGAAGGGDTAGSGGGLSGTIPISAVPNGVFISLGSGGGPSGTITSAAGGTNPDTSHSGYNGGNGLNNGDFGGGGAASLITNGTAGSAGVLVVAGGGGGSENGAKAGNGLSLAAGTTTGGNASGGPGGGGGGGDPAGAGGHVDSGGQQSAGGGRSAVHNGAVSTGSSCCSSGDGRAIITYARAATNVTANLTTTPKAWQYSQGTSVFSATAPSGTPAPTGNLTLSLLTNGTSHDICTSAARFAPNPPATCLVGGLSGGSHTLTVTYPGDAN
jgi:hypothetical protein